MFLPIKRKKHSLDFLRVCIQLGLCVRFFIYFLPEFLWHFGLALELAVCLKI